MVDPAPNVSDAVVAGFVEHVGNGVPDGSLVLDASAPLSAPAWPAHLGVVVERCDPAEIIHGDGPAKVDAVVCVDGLPEDEQPEPVLAALAARARPHALVYLAVSDAADREALSAAATAAGLTVVEQRESGGRLHVLCRAATPVAEPRPERPATVRLLLAGIVAAVAVGFAIMLIAGGFGTAGVVAAAAIEAAAIYLLWRWSPSS